MPTPDTSNVIAIHAAGQPAPRLNSALKGGDRRAAAPLPVFLEPEELAVLLKLPSVETVYQWRRKHYGPPGFRVGRHLRYDLAAVLVWIQQQTEQSA